MLPLERKTKMIFKRGEEKKSNSEDNNDEDRITFISKYAVYG